MKNQRLLGDVLDCLLPAVDELAGAGSLGLADSVLSDPLLAAEPGAIDKVLDALPEDFTDLDPRGKNKSLRLAQKLNPDAFGILISAGVSVMDSMDFLTEVYEDYCTKHSLPYISADEQDLSELSQAQRDWITFFSYLWDSTT